MVTINIKQNLYDELLDLIDQEIRERAIANPKKSFRQFAKKKFGLTFNFIIDKLLKEYKTKHKIK